MSKQMRLWAKMYIKFNKLIFIICISLLIILNNNISKAEIIPSKEIINSLGSREFEIKQVQNTDNKYALLIQSNSNKKFSLMFVLNYQNEEKYNIYDQTEVNPYEAKWIIVIPDPKLLNIKRITVTPYGIENSKMLLFIDSSQTYAITGSEDPISDSKEEIIANVNEPELHGLLINAKSKTFFYSHGNLFKTIDQDNIQRYHHKDLANNIVLVTDELGNSKIQREYLPFGSVAVETGDPIEINNQNKKFLEKDYEGNTGMYLLDHRFYEPNNGRFTQTDPLRHHGESPYSYSNNPLKYVDASGLDPEPSNREITLDPVEVIGYTDEYMQRQYERLINEYRYRSYLDEQRSNRARNQGFSWYPSIISSYDPKLRLSLFQYAPQDLDSKNAWGLNPLNVFEPVRADSSKTEAPGLNSNSVITVKTLKGDRQWSDVEQIYGLSFVVSDLVSGGAQIVVNDAGRIYVDVSSQKTKVTTYLSGAEPDTLMYPRIDRSYSIQETNYFPSANIDLNLPRLEIPGGSLAIGGSFSAAKGQGPDFGVHTTFTMPIP